MPLVVAGSGSFAKLFVKLNLSLPVAAPPNIDCCKYLRLLLFEEGEDDNGDWSYRVFFERKFIRM